jgi:hypothetical protein
MPPIQYPPGNGSTASLGTQASQGRVNGAKGMSPDRSWTYKGISQYNLPSSITYFDDVSAANARNTFLIRQAQRRAEMEAERRRLEEERRLKEMEKQQRLQEQNRAAKRGVGVPSPGKYDEYGNPMPLGGPDPGTYAPFAPDTIGQPQPPGGAFNMLFQRAAGPSAARASIANDEAVRRIMDTGSTQTNIARAKSETAGNIFQEIAVLEQTFESRKAAAAVEAWGRPKELTYYDAETGQTVFGGYDWSYSGSGIDGWGRPVEYLGLERGQVVAPQPVKPGENASYSEVVAYRDQLNQQIRPALYRPESVMDTLYAMGPEGVKQLQKQAVKAQWYPADSGVAFGVIDETIIGLMTEAMTYANINGTTWENIVAQGYDASLQSIARAAAASSGGGGGGGGGGGTTVYKQIQYTETSVAQARTLLTGILREALGREPTDSEVSKFLLILNKAEAKSPNRTITTTTNSGDMTRAVSRSTPSGVDPEALAEEFAQNIDGGRPYEANAQRRYLTALLESLGRPSV